MANHLKHKVILVPFPFDDFKTLKVRPAVCLTNKIGDFEHVIIAFISSRVPLSIMETDIMINEHERDFKETGLKKASILRLHRLVTIPLTLIRREIGTLPKRLNKEINNKLRILFDI